MLTRFIPPAELPPDAKFRSYRDYRQDIVMESRNTRYRRVRLPSSDGTSDCRPAAAIGVDPHFGPALNEFILLQTHQIKRHPRAFTLEAANGAKSRHFPSGQLSNILLKGP